MKEFLKQIISIEEHKGSILVLVLIGISIMGLYKTFKYGDYPDNMLGLTEFLVGTIAGVNIANKFNNTPKV